MYKKRGFSHLEIVISFSLFILFVLFIFLYFNPLKEKQPHEIKILNLKNFFFEKNKVEVIVFFINGSNNCAPLGYEINSSILKNFENSSYIIHSNEIINSLSICSQDVNRGSFRKFFALSNNSLKNFEEEYKNNYINLKKEIFLTKKMNNDFQIISEGYLELNKSFNSGDNVLVLDYPFDVIYSNGTLEKKFFKFMLWE